jgi:hypothetical protein
MDFILDNKWFFLITAEIIFWICAIAFLLLRYWFKLERLSMFIFVIFIVNDLWIAFLAFMDYRRTGEFSVFQIVILIFIVYALTFGKSDFMKLDLFIKRQVAKIRGETIPASEMPVQRYGLDLALYEWKQFVGHLFIFALLHIVFAFAFGLADQFNTLQIEQWLSIINNDDNGLPFNNEGINSVTKIWLIILIIDFVITLSYTVFPKKSPV